LFCYVGMILLLQIILVFVVARRWNHTYRQLVSLQKADWGPVFSGHPGQPNSSGEVTFRGSGFAGNSRWQCRTNGSALLHRVRIGNDELRVQFLGNDYRLHRSEVDCVILRTPTGSGIRLVHQVEHLPRLIWVYFWKVDRVAEALASRQFTVYDARTRRHTIRR
jgi:hypothetical protein